MAMLVQAMASPATLVGSASVEARDPSEPDTFVADTAISCETCVEIVSAVGDFIAGKVGTEIVEGVVKDVCIAEHGGLGWHCKQTNPQFDACEDLCSGIVRVFGPEVTYLASRLAFNGTTDCTALGFCPKASPTAPAAPEAAPALRVAPQELARQETAHRPTGAGVVRIVQVTDIHHDPEYHAGATSDCGEPMCCRAVQGTAWSSNTTCGYWGDYSGDSNRALVASLFAAIAAQRPDAVFATGDDPCHNVWNGTTEFNTGVGVNITRMMASAFATASPSGGPVPVYPALGNHNGFPINQFHTWTPADEAWLYEPLADAYGEAGWLDAAAIASFRRAGYYSSLIPGTNFRVITLNPSLHVTQNYWTLLNSTSADLANMSAWLEGAMAAASSHNESVFIQTHYPVNSGAYTAWMTDIFAPLVSRYHSIIKGVIHGHTHKPQIQTMWAGVNSTTPVVTAYIGAAPTTFGGINPSFRVYEIDRASGEVLDYTDFRVNMAEQGLINRMSPEPAPVWKAAYSARAAYNLTSLSPASWVDLAHRMKTDDTLFRAWEYNYATANPDNANYGLDERKTRVCDILSGTHELFQTCMANY